MARLPADEDVGRRTLIVPTELSVAPVAPGGIEVVPVGQSVRNEVKEATKV